MNLKSNNLQQLLSFSQFKSWEEFDDHIQKWLKAAPKVFTKGEFFCFHGLMQSTKQVPGVCYKKINTVLDEIQEEQGVNLSRDTFKRMLRKAKVRGMIKVSTTVRDNGSQASNLYVFQTYTGTNQEEEQQK